MKKKSYVKLSCTDEKLNADPKIRKWLDDAANRIEEDMPDIYDELLARMHLFNTGGVNVSDIAALKKLR